MRRIILLNGRCFMSLAELLHDNLCVGCSGLTFYSNNAYRVSKTAGLKTIVAFENFSSGEVVNLNHGIIVTHHSYHSVVVNDIRCFNTYGFNTRNFLHKESGSGVESIGVVVFIGEGNPQVKPSAFLLALHIL